MQDSDKIKQLSDEILRVMRESVTDLWKEEDKEFLKKLAEDVAREKVLAEISDKPEEHIRNLKHLIVTLKGEITRKGLKIKAFKTRMFSEILVSIVKTVAIGGVIQWKG